MKQIVAEAETLTGKRISANAIEGFLQDENVKMISEVFVAMRPASEIPANETEKDKETLVEDVRQVLEKSTAEPIDGSEERRGLSDKLRNMLSAPFMKNRAGMVGGSKPLQDFLQRDFLFI